MATRKIYGWSREAKRAVLGVLNDIVALVNEQRTDHGGFKTTVDQLETLAEELGADHATSRTVDVDMKALLNQLRTAALYQALGNPTFAIDTNFDVKNTEPISYTNGGTVKTLADNTSFDTGTSQVIAADKWSAALLSVSSAGAATVTWSATLNAANEAAAIAALPALPANHTPLGYVTVLTGTGVTWTAGTDALATGTGGTAATTTNYYNSINPNAAIIGAAVSSSPPATLSASIAITSAPATISAGAVDDFTDEQGTPG